MVLRSPPRAPIQVELTDDQATAAAGIACGGPLCPDRFEEVLEEWSLTHGREERDF